MTRSRRSKVCGLLLWAGVGLAAVAGGQKAAGRAQLLKMPAGQAAGVQRALEGKPLNGASVKVQSTFVLSAPDVAKLGLATVLLWPGGDPTNPGSCGVVFLDGHGGQRYVNTVTPSATHTEMCEGTAAVGLMTEPAVHPRLITIFNVSAGHGPDTTLPVVLQWQEATSAYEVDKGTSDWVADQPGSETVAGVRRLLARRSTPKS